MMPYMSMATAKASPSITIDQRRRNILTNYSDFLFSTQISTIRLLINERKWLMLAIIFLQAVVMLFLVPLKNVFVQLLPDDSGWIVSVSLISASILMAVYTLLIICTASLLLWMRDLKTGLKWDAACIADQFALIRGSNILKSFQGLEFASRREMTDAFSRIASSQGLLRLGYWKHKSDRATFWHGIAFLPQGKHSALKGSHRRSDEAETENKTGMASTMTEVPRSKPNGRILRFKRFWRFGFIPSFSRQLADPDDYVLPLDPLNETPLDWNHKPIPDPEYYRHRDTLHSDGYIAVHILLASMVLSALIVIVVKGVVHKGFHFDASRIIPQLQVVPSSTSDDGFSFSNASLEPVLKNFIFSFCPSLVMAIFSSLWFITDNFYRTVQPMAAMSEAAPASQSILLDYMQSPAFLAIPRAVLNGHWRVAWFSLLAPSANVGPILAVGIFVSSPKGDGFDISISPVNLWFIISLLSIYLLSLPFAIPRPRHILPRRIFTIADIICYCYASQLVDDPIFSVQEPDDEQIHLISKVYLAKQFYEIGLYLGKDGRRHIGIDVASRTLRCDPGRWLQLFGLRVWLRKPKVLVEEE